MANALLAGALAPLACRTSLSLAARALGRLRRRQRVFARLERAAAIERNDLRAQIARRHVAGPIAIVGPQVDATEMHARFLDVQAAAGGASNRAVIGLLAVGLSDVVVVDNQRHGPFG